MTYLHDFVNKYTKYRMLNKRFYTKEEAIKARLLAEKEYL